MVHYFDMKVAQDIKVRIGNTTNTLQLSCDIMNVGNLLNDSWGVMTTWSDTANSGQILTLDHFNSDGQPVFSTPLKEGAKGVSSWQVQLR